MSRPYVVKKVTHAGTIRLKDKLFFILDCGMTPILSRKGASGNTQGASSGTLKQLLIGLEEIEDGIRSLYLNHLLLGKIDESDMVFTG